MSFLQLTENEVILKTYHRHWFAYVGDVISILTFIVSPFVLVVVYFFLPQGVRDQLTNSSIFTGSDFTHTLLALTFMWLFFAWMIGWRRWTDLYLDAIVITNERIYQIKQHGFFSRIITSFPIARIQNVTVKTEGFLATMLGFGELELETAGEGEDAELDMTMMPDPEEIKLYINSAHDYKGGNESGI